MRSVDAALLPDPAVREFLLRRHDLLVLNNRACVHARRPVAGHSERAVVHCKVAERDVRPDLTYLVGPAAAHAD
jgi:alpha-ketoglutarate-dependent taurine dioxygenase